MKKISKIEQEIREFIDNFINDEEDLETLRKALDKIDENHYFGSFFDFIGFDELIENEQKPENWTEEKILKVARKFWGRD